MSDDRRVPVTEILSGPLKGQTIRAQLEEDGSWPASIILTTLKGDSGENFALRHVGEGRYEGVPESMIWEDSFEAIFLTPHEVEGDDIWPPTVMVEHWQRTRTGEKRLIARRPYTPVPLDQVEHLRDLEEPRWPTPVEERRMREVK